MAVFNDNGQFLNVSLLNWTRPERLRAEEAKKKTRLLNLRWLTIFEKFNKIISFDGKSRPSGTLMVSVVLRF